MMLPPYLFGGGGWISLSLPRRYVGFILLISPLSASVWAEVAFATLARSGGLEGSLWFPAEALSLSLGAVGCQFWWPPRRVLSTVAHLVSMDFDFLPLWLGGGVPAASQFCLALVDAARTGSSGPGPGLALCRARAGVCLCAGWAGSLGSFSPFLLWLGSALFGCGPDTCL